MYLDAADVARDTGVRRGASLSPSKVSTTPCWQRSWARDLAWSAERAMIALLTCRPALTSCAAPISSRLSPTGRRAYSARSSTRRAWRTISRWLLSPTSFGRVRCRKQSGRTRNCHRWQAPEVTPCVVVCSMSSMAGRRVHLTIRTRSQSPIPNGCAQSLDGGRADRATRDRWRLRGHPGVSRRQAWRGCLCGLRPVAAVDCGRRLRAPAPGWLDAGGDSRRYPVLGQAVR
jgi:hypothetical protein